METKIKALAKHLECKKSEITQSVYDENTFEYGSSEYLVVNDDEADELWEQDLDNYLEEIIYPELEGNLKNYFNDEAWKSDARYDGRAHSLARYDGNEYEQDGFYIYQTN
jgi:hypothetical protein